jgi:uncharacterized membrane protein YbhN (UPF0104 family)
MEDYGRQLRVIALAFAVSVPAHAAVVASAILAGHAFGLPLSTGYYFVAVPVIVLAGVLPLAPQGVGVMEFAAVMLTRGQGVTVAEALALAMSIRLVPVAWSLLGGAFLLWGSHRPAVAAAADDAPVPRVPTPALVDG